MTWVRLLALSAAGCLAFGVAQAQTPGSAGNTTPTTPPAGATGMGPHGAGMGGPHGMGPGMQGGMHAGPGNTMGWSMMTPEERKEHQAKMMSFTNAKDCRAYVEQHHRLMAERAKQRGMAMPATPMHDPCAGLKD